MTTSSLVLVPFLAEVQKLKGTASGEKVEFTLPPVERGAVVWAEEKN